VFDVYLVVVFGILGYFLSKYGFGTAPVVLGMILGEVAESSFRQAMMMYKADWTVFFSRPISLGFLICAVVFTSIPLYRKWQDSKKAS
jgi:putative tricarboxylic transport membrane protein